MINRREFVSSAIIASVTIQGAENAMPTAMDLERAETVDQLANALIKTAGEQMKTHGGHDPNALVILSAAFCLAVDRITKSIDPTFRIRVTTQLVENKP
jgi:hypothetical protein